MTDVGDLICGRKRKIPARYVDTESDSESSSTSSSSQSTDDSDPATVKSKTSINLQSSAANVNGDAQPGPVPGPVKRTQKAKVTSTAAFTSKSSLPTVTTSCAQLSDKATRSATFAAGSESAGGSVAINKTTISAIALDISHASPSKVLKYVQLDQYFVVFTTALFKCDILQIFFTLAQPKVLKLVNLLWCLTAQLYRDVAEQEFADDRFSVFKPAFDRCVPHDVEALALVEGLYLELAHAAANANASAVPPVAASASSAFVVDMESSSSTSSSSTVVHTGDAVTAATHSLTKAAASFAAACLDASDLSPVKKFLIVLATSIYNVFRDFVRADGRSRERGISYKPRAVCTDSGTVDEALFYVWGWSAHDLRARVVGFLQRSAAVSSDLRRWERVLACISGIVSVVSQLTQDEQKLIGERKPLFMKRNRGGLYAVRPALIQYTDRAGIIIESYISDVGLEKYRADVMKVANEQLQTSAELSNLWVNACRALFPRIPVANTSDSEWAAALAYTRREWQFKVCNCVAGDVLKYWNSVKTGKSRFSTSTTRQHVFVETAQRERCRADLALALDGDESLL